MNPDQLHELVMTLRREIAAGKITVRSKHTIEALKNVRYGADGKVDPATVDGSVRALGLAVLANESRRRAEAIPLRESQSAYFEVLDDLFGNAFREMRRSGLNVQDVAASLASDSKRVEIFREGFPELSSTIRDFWEHYGPSVQVHLEGLRSLKSVYSGDISPSYLSNIACSVGLYMDTIVLPDPIFRLIQYWSTPGGLKPQNQFFYLTKHALNVLEYKELALADVMPPIVVIAPGLTADSQYHSVLSTMANSDVIEHFSRLFGRSFSDVRDIISFLKQFSEPSALVSALTEPDRLLINAEWSGTPEQQLARYVAKIGPEFEDQTLIQDLGSTVISLVLGRMLQANDTLLESSQYCGSPLVDAPTSWQYLLWKYEYDVQQSKPESTNLRDVLVSKAVQVEGNPKLGMISGIPPESLIELRKNGAVAELREVIGKGITSINSASASDVAEIRKLVISNIDEAFAKHDGELRALISSKQRYFGVDVGRWIVVGGMSIAAAATASPACTVLASVLGMTLGLPDPLTLHKQWKELQAKGEGLRRSPTGILFRHLGVKFGFS